MHSEYSVSDGIVRLDEAVQRAAADGMPALALTDLANLFGLVKFYRAARGAGVMPLASRAAFTKASIGFSAQRGSLTVGAGLRRGG